MKSNASRTPEWTESEFRVLVTSFGVSDSELKSKLPRRSIGAIDVVREGVHTYHVGNNSTILSQMMTDYLSRNHSHAKCPKCGVTF
jgi:hypothetical protein